MSQDFVKKIYDSYSRADEARIHKTEGAGLGMAITKYIVDAMEGSIEVQSDIDRGTEFRITFDFEKAAAMEVDMVLPSWNMLVVDDDELLCRTAMNALKSIGIKAEWTLSGEKAIDLVISAPHQERRLSNNPAGLETARHEWDSDCKRDTAQSTGDGNICPYRQFPRMTE